MNISSNIDLSKHHTFGINCIAENFLIVKSVSHLRQAIKLPFRNKLILGGGSNLVFTSDFEGLIIKNEIKGKAVSRNLKTSKYVTAKAGENWHDFVMWTLSKNLGGLENLSLIPGTVGAAPIQNIGAYGVELKDVFIKLRAIELKTGKIKTFWKKDCKFGYRNSYFKNKGKGKYVILEVTFKLSKKPHFLNTSYGSITKELEKRKIKNPNIHDLANAVIKIRQSKLPDPSKIGNCGSFFKNPIVDQRTFLSLSANFPGIPNYPAPKKKVKLAAGWLIDQCGWKGKRIGSLGCYKNQALVIVNHGNAKGSELLNFIQTIKDSVFSKFKIKLEEEVNLI